MSRCRDSQYTVSGAVVTILDTLTSGAVIQLKYWKANAVNATNYTKAESDSQFATKIEDPTTDDQVLVKNADGSYRYEPYGGGSSTPTGMDGHDTYLI